MNYFRKILCLIKDIRNFPHFIYHIYHYANRYVPLRIAHRISKQNRKEQREQGIVDVYVPTNDGSNQVVHPDFDLYNGKILLVCTPYPYGMEEYENPCLYIGQDIDNLQPLHCPLDTQSKHTQGIHLSDPCIAVIQNEIICIYRDTRYKEDTIYLKKLHIDETGTLHNSDRQLILHSNDEFVLSPAMLLSKEDLWLYSVKLKDNYSKLVLDIFHNNDFNLKSTQEVKVLNEPDQYYLWHIGITTADDYIKVIDVNQKLVGLFLYINHNDTNDLRLYLAEGSVNNPLEWSLDKEVFIPDEIKKVMWFPYKSCFNPLSKNILLSFRDYKKRNRLVEIETI